MTSTTRASGGAGSESPGPGSIAGRSAAVRSISGGAGEGRSGEDRSIAGGSGKGNSPECGSGKGNSPAGGSGEGSSTAGGSGVGLTPAGRTPAVGPTTAHIPWRLARPALVVAFWVGVWWVAAVVIDQSLLLASPGEVLARLGDLVVTADFWATVAHSLVRIGTGFLAATVTGTLTAAVSARVTVVDALLTPLMTVIRTVPVVSFIVLVLMWADSDQLAVVISFLMVTPVIYTNVLAGIHARDRALLEVATVFGVPWHRRLPAVDVPAVLPFLIAGCRVGIGLAWKSGVAAEVIGLPEGSIGERLYEAKLFLSTADLFAWTVVIVAISVLFEKVVVAVLALRDPRPSPGRAT